MKEIHIFEAHQSYVLDLIFTRDGNTLISAFRATAISSPVNGSGPATRSNSSTTRRSAG